jgi:cyclic beta-1,2-glucan synthetase
MGFFLFWILGEFTPLCRERGDVARAQRYETHREELREALEANAWDGEWYRRGYYDDGTPLGSKESDECRIDALAQAWSVLSGAAAPDRAAQAMASVERHLVSEADGLIRLLTPPFENTSHDPGYIAATCAACARTAGSHARGAVGRPRGAPRRNDRVAKLLELMTRSHARTPELVDVPGEPYVVR